MEREKMEREKRILVFPLPFMSSIALAKEEGERIKVRGIGLLISSSFNVQC
jgi:hypothetical protein